MNKLVVSALLSTLFISSCKKTHVTTNNTPVVVSKDSIIVSPKQDSILKVVEVPVVKPSSDLDEDKVKIDDIDFNYLKAKAKVSFKSPHDSQNVNVDIRMKKDSVIWLNVSAFGLSAANALFTKDVVKLYDKIHGDYQEFTYPQFAEKFNFNVDYDIIQALIIGNRPFKKKKSRVVRDNEYYLLKQQDDKVLIDNYIGQNRKLKKLLLTQENTNNKLSLDFEDFTTLNEYLFPQSSLITVDYKSEKDQKMYQTVVNIKHTKVELLDTPLEFPFKIPERLLNKNH
ncbi:MAG: DUF4292 domain-containing protein [Spirosomataceae bacterium]|nr:DUF4292 domain-containing protein [Flectobacillus sp.]